MYCCRYNQWNTMWSLKMIFQCFGVFNCLCRSHLLNEAFTSFLKSHNHCHSLLTLLFLMLLFVISVALFILKVIYNVNNLIVGCPCQKGSF